MPNRLLALLNLRPGEEKNVLPMLAHYFFMGGAMLFVQSASLALFFEAWEVTAMPYIYLGIAVIVSSITALFLKVSERTSLARFLVLCLLFVLIGTIVLRGALLFTQSKWLLLALPIWAQTLVNLSAMAFWTLAGSLFDVRQGKRIFGLLNAGSWLAYVVMGLFTAPLAQRLGTENLYVVVALCLLVAFLFQIVILRANPRTSETVEPQPGKQKASPSNLLRNRYVLLIFLLIAVWRVAYFILDNIFYDRAALRYPDTAAMAGFIGGFFGVVGVLGFLTDTFFTGRIISRFGLMAGLLATPILTTLSTAALALTGLINPQLLLPLFWFAVLAKFSNEGLGFSIDQSSFAVLYQPIEEKIRIRAQTVAEGIVQPLAIGLAGALLLILTTLLRFNIIQLALVYLLVGAVWIALSYRLTRAYPAALTEALHKRRFGDSGLPVLDRVSLETLQQALQNADPNFVRQALDLLEKSGNEVPADSLLPLLNSPDVSLRVEVLQRIERREIRDALPAIQKHLHSESNPRVREAAARALTVITRDPEKSLRWLATTDPSIQRGALIGLLRTHEPADVQPALELLHRLARSTDATERLEATDLLASIARPSLHSILLPLLEDADLAVRHGALRAAAHIRHAALYPVIVRLLGSPQTRSLALRALVHGGEMALPAMIEALQDESLHRRVHLRLVRACTHLRSPAAIRVLEGLICHHNTTLRGRALTALEACGYRPRQDAIRTIEQQVQAEIRRAAWLLAGSRDLANASKTETLFRALVDDLSATRERLFYLFGFLYNPQSVQRARKAFIRRDENRKAYAIEVMDSLLSREHRKLFIPLLEDIPAPEQLQRMGFEEPKLPRMGRVIEILANPFALQNPWIVATAIEVSRAMGLAGADQVIESLGRSNESLIVRIVTQVHKEKNMLSTVERVIILKSLSMFADTPDEALYELADLLHEEEVQPGEVIIRQGETGESLYIIVRGQVEVVDGERVINQLGERAAFGELSLLDSSPRTATVRAVQETSLLRLDQMPFYELMSDYVEVAMGTIRMLTRNLRARTDELLELNRILGQ